MKTISNKIRPLTTFIVILFTIIASCAIFNSNINKTTFRQIFSDTTTMSESKVESAGKSDSAIVSIVTWKNIGAAPVSDFSYYSPIFWGHEVHIVKQEGSYDYALMIKTIKRALKTNEIFPADNKNRRISINRYWFEGKKGCKEVIPAVNEYRLGILLC